MDRLLLLQYDSAATDSYSAASKVSLSQLEMSSISVCQEKPSESLRPGQVTTVRRTQPDVFLFSHSRTASNLLCRLLSEQPGWIQSEYHYQDAFIWARKSFNWGPVAELSEQQRQRFEQLIRKGHDGLDQARSTAISNVSDLVPA